MSGMGEQVDLIDEFRAAIRLSAADSSKTVHTFLYATFDFVPTGDDDEKVLTFADFEKGIMQITAVNKKIRKSDISEIFEDIDVMGQGKVTVEDLADFCQRSISKARALSLKLRKSIIDIFKDDGGLQRAFSTMAGSSKYAEINHFTEFAEDSLGVVINESDAVALYGLYDTDGDGKISQNDFLSFMGNPSTPDAARAVDVGDQEVILDVKVSSSRAQDDELIRQGYFQILPDFKKVAQAYQRVDGSFGKGNSVWIWKRKQGSCAGKLKPIIDIQLLDSNPSSTMVLSGYSCLTVPISGQWVWIKRAVTLAEEEECIVDMQVTIGKMSNPVDTIWSGPGSGWIRVDGNFGKSFINVWTADAFLWYLPSKTRAAESLMASPVRFSSFLSEEARQEQLLSSIRRFLRHYVPLETMRESADPFNLHNNGKDESEVANKGFDIRTVKYHDFSCSNLFYKYCSAGSKTLSLSRFKSMLYDVGLRMDKGEVGAQVFHYFDFKQDKSINREEFNQFLSLTPFELDETVMQIKERLWKVTKGTSKLKHNRLLRDIFNLININGNKILDLVEILMLTSRLGIFLTEEEGRDLRYMMDLDKDDKVTEKDFVGFMKSSGNLAAKRAHRVRDSALSLRRWLIRGSSGLGAGNSTKANAWKELEKQHRNSYGSKFPGYFIPVDFSLIMSKLGVLLSPLELREITMLVAPTEDGRVHKHDIERFMNSSCRAFGEILSILEKDVLKPVVDVYKEIKAEHEKKSSAEGKRKIELLQNEYDEIIGEVVHEVRNHRMSADDPGGAELKHDVVSAVQVKAGIETLLSSFYSTPPHLVPNLEEWVCLACLTDSAVTDENHYGINIKKLLEGICLAITGGIDSEPDPESTSVDMLCRDLQRMIIEEAQAAGSRSKSGRKMDYQAAFALFDDDGNGTITAEEFQNMLVRLQLVDLLPEGQLALVVAKFDTQGKGYISYDDFEAFAESGMWAGVMLGMDEEEEEEDFGMSSNTPPVAITKNSDMDWLAWFLYKEAYRIDPVDPESVINELEAVCTESEVIDNQGAVTKKELWTLLFELKLKGNMSHRQFETAVDHIVCENSDDKNAAGDELVDYESLCRYVIRMGRAYNSLVQEQKKSLESKYKELKNLLLKELTSMVSHGTEKANKFDSRKEGMFSMEHGKGFGTSNFRYEKVFRRLDDDGDGRINCREFKNGLRRLRISNEKAWSLKLIRKLFDDCDDNGDGLLDLKEFSTMINNWINGNPNETDAATKQMVSDLHLDDDDRDDGDDGIFKRERVIYDSELFQKVTATLMDVVPAGNTSGYTHVEAVKSAVRKFFGRSDPDNTGVVSEERFRAFCRRSSLQERLSTSEMRALLDKLRKKNRRSRIRSSSMNGYVIDYERFLHQISKNGESVPHSHAESALTRLQDAATESAAAGRPFIGLCSLVDPKLTGCISAEELLLTVKMMGITMSLEELRAVQELLPPGAVGKDGSFDYRELYWVIQHHTPPPPVGQRGDFVNTFDFGARTLAPTTPLPGDTGYRGAKRGGGYRETPRDNMDYGGGALSTPMGTMVATPMRGGGETINTALYRSSQRLGHTTTDRDRNRDRDIDPRYSTSAGGGMGMGMSQSARALASSSAYERQIDLLGERTKLAVEDKSREWGSPFSLRKQFEVYDTDMSGLVSLRTFQSTLDDIGVLLSATEIHAVQSYFGRPEDNLIDYHSFCQTFFEDTTRSHLKSNTYNNSSRQIRGGGTIGRNSYDRDRDSLPLPSRITDTLRKLKSEGKDPRDIFEAYDLDQTGLVDVKDFRRVVNQLQLLQSERQLIHAEETFASLSDRSLICYEDFCRSLEANGASEFGAHEYGATRRGLEQSGVGTRLRAVLGDGYDGTRRGNSNGYDDGYNEGLGGTRGRGGYDRDRDRDLRGEMDYDHHTPRDNFSYTNNNNTYSNRLSESRGRSSYDRGGEGRDEFRGSLLPPKPSDSVSRFRTGTGGGRSSSFNNSSSYDSGRFRSTSPTPLSRSMESPRSPPAKVGSIMWGSDTPLAQKGTTPYLAGAGSSKWVCSVCYFTENQEEAQSCEVCDSPNYSINKDFQSRLQCYNCTFLNGHFAKECEMCGHKL